MLSVYAILFAACLAIRVFAKEMRDPYYKGYWTCLTYVSGSMFVGEVITLFWP